MQANSTRGTVQASAAGASGSTGAPPLQEVLSQLFQSLGLDTQSSKALETLIALLILVAVLESMQQASGHAGGSSASGSNALTGADGFNAHFSSTTISFEQSTTTVSYGNAAALTDQLGSAAQSSLGDNIDYCA